MKSQTGPGVKARASPSAQPKTMKGGDRYAKRNTHVACKCESAYTQRHKVKSYTRGSVKEVAKSVKTAAKQYFKTGSTGNKTSDRGADHIIGRVLSKMTKSPAGMFAIPASRALGKGVETITSAKLKRNEKRKKKK